ncbi:hypothetical protein SAMN05216343_12728 [Oscillibacter sp. PC13]|uniref:hypothetical protein n=1 Tax=Oscillibacter sp. PC13 TaxID=1855299 RepID=UPI0008F3AC46|nr:hypothetical protein [Oscillibacter sp. PC13]SFQ16100.1 hypothetical protein SAMN05216343_12728 [Oscillibacter sp. PC13]
MSMKSLIVFVLAMSCGITLSGCTNDTADAGDGGFIRKTYTGIVEEQNTENDNEYIRVNIGNNEVIDFLIRDTSEMDHGESISEGDAVEIDCVHWYDPSIYEILKLSVDDSASNTDSNNDTMVWTIKIGHTTDEAKELSQEDMGTI